MSPVKMYFFCAIFFYNNILYLIEAVWSMQNINQWESKGTEKKPETKIEIWTLRLLIPNIKGLDAAWRL